MICPYCKYSGHFVNALHIKGYHEKGIDKGRACKNCGKMYTTGEQVINKIPLSAQREVFMDVEYASEVL